MRSIQTPSSTKMAPSTLSVCLLTLFILSPFSTAKSPPKPKAFTFPIKKDTTTNQYYTTIEIGSNTTTFSVVIDLGAKSLYFNSLDYSNAASSYRPILCDTPQCAVADGFGCVICYTTPLLPPDCTTDICSDYALNPFTGTQAYSGLGQDRLSVHSTRGHKYTVNDFSFLFSDPVLRRELASMASGVIGLGRSRISLPAKLASTFKIREKFSLCIPTSNNDGNMIIGQGKYKSPFQEISKSLFTTGLIRNPVPSLGNEVIGNFSVEYFIDVKGIKVGEKTLRLNKTLLSIDENTGGGGTAIRTVRGYTSLERSIYKTLIKEFVKAASITNIKRVASVAPFGACFDSKTIVGSKTGPQVPSIDLVMSNNVYWRFYGSNSMVKVGNGITCLAFVEGQPALVGPTTSVVVGGYQMENHLLEFNVASSRLGFSSSLMLHDTSCSQFKAV